jgi:hypothetical protein
MTAPIIICQGFWKRALVSSASTYVTKPVINSPAVRFNDQVNIGTDNSTAAVISLWNHTSTSSGIRDANDYQAVSGNLAVLMGNTTW